MARFDNISDEMLAAFIDGNTLPVESMIINNAIPIDGAIAEVVDIAKDINDFVIVSDVKDAEVLNSLFGFPNPVTDKLESNTSSIEQIIDKIL